MSCPPSQIYSCSKRAKKYAYSLSFLLNRTDVKFERSLLSEPIWSHSLYKPAGFVGNKDIGWELHEDLRFCFL